ncbi:hypothetical protein EJB05_35241 [Eragrostis curvula]|uniref:CW-type domain-containing protein n=1 Tax=Eragrostis curvula TaxID=38414 RepID=A0A5J9U778_9POAL|nr:hypothetical protein EJB05_35241 [Eragrostis curvula]
MGYEEGELQLEDCEAVFGGGAGYGHRRRGGGAGWVVDLDALTYIDEKLQNLLGCFQKKFEGEISAENLGSQYGGYGSFLPTYPHSPLVLSQSRSPAVRPHHNSASRSPYVPMETAQKNYFVKTALDSNRRNDHYQISNESNGNPSQQMLNKVENGPEQKAPKIRIKVNSNRSLARNTADIYSGLGLDISPSSSVEGSPDGSARSPLLDVLPDESPSTIFQIMTNYSIPGGLLLSPLSENVLVLREKPKIVIERHEASELHDGKAKLHRERSYTTSATLNNKEQMVKENTDELQDNIPDFKRSKHRLKNPPAVDKGIKPQLPDISDDTDSMVLPGTMKTEHLVDSATFMREISDQLKETKNGPPKGHIVDKNKESRKAPSLDHAFSGKTKYDSDEYNSRSFASSSHLKNVPNETTSIERDKGTSVHIKAEHCQYKSKEGGSLSSAESVDIVTKTVDRNSSGMIKANKTISSSQPALSRRKIRVKAHKQLNDDRTRKSCGEDENYALGRRIDSTNVYPKDKKLKLDVETVSSGEIANRSCGGNGVEHKINSLVMEKSDPMPSASKNENAESSIAPIAAAPVVINEEWVCCDECETWRLLPYGMNPDTLPKEWQCNMQYWLPGMNSCDISEAETSRALRALYMVPASENNIRDGCRDNATSGIGTATAPAFEGNIQPTSTSGKRKGCHDGANVANNLDLNDMSKPSKKLHADSSRNSDGVDRFRKHKEKRKHIESSNKGENALKDRTPPMGTSAGVDHDNLRASKKIKKEFNEPATYHSPKFAVSKSSPSINGTQKIKHKHIGNSSAMREYGSSSSGNHFHGEDKCLSDEVIIKTSGTGKSDFPDLSTKNKKSKHGLSSQCDPDPLPSNAAKGITKQSESNAVKENYRSELKLSKADRAAAHGRGGIAGVDDFNTHAEKEFLSEQRQEKIHVQHSFPFQSSTRRNFGHAQTTAATSSSSKVSNSHKDKADFQETRASPVESVSSSPLRTLDKNPLDQYKRHSWAVTENIHSQESGKKGLSRSKKKYDFGSDSDKAKARVSGSFNGDMDHHVLKDEALLTDDQDLKNACLNKSDKQRTLRENGKTPPHFSSNQSDHANLSSGKVKPDKGNIQYKDLKGNPSTVKGSNQYPPLTNAANGDATCKAKQSEKAKMENLETRKQVTLSEGAVNPVNASVLLKEARDLKHLSKRLKEKGDDFESTSMCFEAALKFLHVASLWEAPSTDSSKQVDSIQAMKLYSETGNLCGFCAHEFERLKKMANAALAYKCVEVAYMKAAFFKHPGAIKDRHAMQTASLMAPPAESPSSSASDVDNLNNQSTVAKAVSVRGVYSPQMASNPISRNNHHLMGLLAYTEDVNNGFEGTRKSQNSFSAYLSGIGKNQVDGVALLREVLDFSFHNVKGLLQLIRQSLESINHESVK